jgi:hypothetical protein
MLPFARVGTIGALAAFALQALTACSGAFGDQVHEQVHQTLAAGSAPHVRVNNVAGTVRVDGTSSPFVDVTATKYGHDAQELQSIRIEVVKEDAGVSIATGYAGGMSRGGVSYRIDVPANASLEILNVAGAVDIAGVNGSVDVETQAGRIGVHAGRVIGSRVIDLRATTGAVALSVAPGSSARVEAESTVGAFASDIPGISSDRQNLVGSRGGGRIGAGSASIRLTTTTGAIVLREQP